MESSETPQTAAPEATPTVPPVENSVITNPEAPTVTETPAPIETPTAIPTEASPVAVTQGVETNSASNTSVKKERHWYNPFSWFNGATSLSQADALAAYAKPGMEIPTQQMAQSITSSEVDQTKKAA